ncbi:hypothetical protein WJX77_001135 [Trebouxia sp. C0004]
MPVRSKREPSSNPADSHMPSRRSFRLNPQTTAEVAASEEPSELALFIVTGTCPRCGKYQDSRHKAHLERKQCKSRADKLLELKIAGLMNFTLNHARVVVTGSTGNHYIVELKDRSPTCECPDYFYRHRFCKHLWLIFMYLGMFERYQRQNWHQAVSAKLSELTETAHRKEELHLVELKREPEQLAASPCKLEGAAAAAIAAVGPRAALAVIAEHLMSICSFVAVKAAETIGGQNRHPLLTHPPGKKRKRPPGSKDKQTPEAVQVKAEGTEVKAEETELKAEETDVKAEITEVKAEERALQPLNPKPEGAVDATSVSAVFVDTPSPMGDASYAKHHDSPNIPQQNMPQQMSISGSDA